MTLQNSDVKHNIFPRSYDYVINNESKFKWHPDAGKPNSSQAIAVDFWGCVSNSPMKNEILNLLFSKNAFDWEIEFEYTNRKVLSEKISTQIDVKIESKSTLIAIFIESKFTEEDGGSCTQWSYKTKKGVIQCNGCFELQKNENNNVISKCALIGKGIKYWEYIDKLTDYNQNEVYTTPCCPFKYGTFQWMRNICFAKAYGDNFGFNTETYLAYYESEKCSISKKVNNGTYLGTLKDKIKNLDSLKPKSYNKMLETIIDYLKDKNIDEKQVWDDLRKFLTQKENEIKP